MTHDVLFLLPMHRRGLAFPCSVRNINSSVFHTIATATNTTTIRLLWLETLIGHLLQPFIQRLEQIYTLLALLLL